MGPPGPEGLKGEQGPLVTLFIRGNQCVCTCYTHRVTQVLMERRVKKAQKETRLVYLMVYLTTELPQKRDVQLLMYVYTNRVFGKSSLFALLEVLHIHIG